MTAARFSLAALLLWMAMIAVGCQALVSHTPLWTYLVVSATVTLFGLALLTALASAGGKRAYLLGFALAGGGYLLLTLYPLMFHLGEQLLTTRVLMVFWSEVGEQPPQPQPGQPQPGGSGNAAWGTPAATAAADDDGDYEAMMNGGGFLSAASGQDYYRSKRSYLFIGQCLWAVLLAFPAGLFCAWQYERRIRRERGGSAPASGARPGVG